jgi:hypothetical protein
LIHSDGVEAFSLNNYAIETKIREEMSQEVEKRLIALAVSQSQPNGLIRWKNVPIVLAHDIWVSRVFPFQRTKQAQKAFKSGRGEEMENAA